MCHHALTADYQVDPGSVSLGKSLATLTPNGVSMVADLLNWSFVASSITGIGESLSLFSGLFSCCRSKQSLKRPDSFVAIAYPVSGLINRHLVHQCMSVFQAQP